MGGVLALAVRRRSRPTEASAAVPPSTLDLPSTASSENGQRSQGALGLPGSLTSALARRSAACHNFPGAWPRLSESRAGVARAGPSSALFERGRSCPRWTTGESRSPLACPLGASQARACRREDVRAGSAWALARKRSNPLASLR
eukprot:scaffold7342_cov269-Pinguiococcus_pyrenoidosus.AAC.6